MSESKRNRFNRNWDRFYGDLEWTLIRARKKHHITQPMLAKLVGVSYPHYQRMERGEHPFKPRQLRLLADQFGLDLQTLIDQQDTDRLLRAAGYHKNPNRARYLITHLYNRISLSDPPGLPTQSLNAPSGETSPDVANSDELSE